MPCGLSGRTAGPRRDDQQIGHGTMHDHRLAPVDHPHAARLARGGLDTVQLEARPRLGVREGELHRAVHDSRQQDLALLLAAAQADGAAGQHHGRQVRLDHQRAAERLHHDHRVHAAAAEAAELLGDRHAQQPHRGKPLPGHRAHALARIDDRPALLERVVLGEELLDRVLQQLLLFRVVEVHVCLIATAATRERKSRSAQGKPRAS